MQKYEKPAESAGSGSGRTEADRGSLVSADARAHREHLKNIKQHKKKKRKQIIGLCLEVLLLCIVIVGYYGVSFAEEVFGMFQRPSETTSQTEARTLPGLPYIGPGGTNPDITRSGEEETKETIIVTDAEGKSTEVEIDPEYTNPAPKEEDVRKSGFRTLLVYGVDARDAKTLTKNTQGDVIIIASINNDSREVRLASVYRDFFFEPTSGYQCKITDYYARFGAEYTMQALNTNLDLQITDCVTVNWMVVADLVDMMDGLDIDMTAAEAEALDQFMWETMKATGRTAGASVDYKDGIQHLNGVQVVCYGRIRKGVGDDFARTQRQRKCIDLALKKLQTMKLSTILNMVKKVASEMFTTLDNAEMLTLASEVFKYRITQNTGFPFKYYSHEFICADDLEANVKQLHEFLYNDKDYEPSANIKRIAELHAKQIEKEKAGH